MRAISFILVAILAQSSRAEIRHSFSWSALQPNGDFAVDVRLLSIEGNNWRAATVDVSTAGGVTIASPLDNLPFAWGPPVIDPELAFDTYFVSPNAPTTAPQMASTPIYSPTSLNITWPDVAGTVAPADFVGARVGLEGNGAYPSVTIEPVGTPLLTLTIHSVGILGSGQQYVSRYSIYDGVPEPGTALLLGAGLAASVRRRRGAIQSAP